MRRYDVGIVGAGPAGAWAAARLARAGASVALIDGSHPREKPCGGGLTARALDIVRTVDPMSVPGVVVHTGRFAHGDRIAEIGLGDTGGAPLMVMSRSTFDAALVAAAAEAGAVLVARRATGIERTAGGWRIATRGGADDAGDADRVIEAGWLIGADGPASLVRRRVFRPFARTDLSLATGYFVGGTSPAARPGIDIAFLDSPAGYLWSFPRPDHLAVGACAQADVSTPEVLLRLSRQWIERHVGTGPSVRLERYSWPIPSLGERALAREEPSGDRWLLVGDAAGLVDPITREGIYFALESAELAARSLLSSSPAATYRTQIRDTIHGELRRAARLKASFFRPRFMGLLLKALQTSRPVRDIMADLVAGRQPYRGLRRRLLGTLELKLMVDTYRARY